MAVKKTSTTKVNKDKLTPNGVNKDGTITNSEVNPTGKITTGSIPGITSGQKQTVINSEVNPTGKIVSSDIPGITTDSTKKDTTGIIKKDTTGTIDTINATKDITGEKTLKEQVAETVINKKTREQELNAENTLQGRDDLVNLQKGFIAEATSVQEDLDNITAGLNAEGGAITSIAASRIKEARSAPLREVLASLVEGQSLTSASISELDTSVTAILEARELDRQDAASTLAQQIEASTLSDEEKNRLTAELGVQTAQATQRDELEAFQKKAELTAQIEADEAESISNTGLTAAQNLESATIIQEFDVDEDSIAGQSIRDMLKEGSTPDQIRDLLKLSTDETGAIDEEAFSRQKSLRTEFEGKATVSNYLEAVQQYKGLISNLGTATGVGDMASIFSFMKTLDPSSVVRESEFDLAAQSMGLGEQAKNFLSGDKLIDGAFLTEEGRSTFAQIAKTLFDNRKDAFDETAKQYINLAVEAGVNPGSVVLDIKNIPGASNLTNSSFTNITEDDTTAINSAYGETSGFTSSSGTTFSVPERLPVNEDFNIGDQTSSPKVTSILGDLEAMVLPKGGDNTVLGLSGGSLTYRTNNPLAITATGSSSAERLTNKYGAMPNLFSPDSADNLVLNFKTTEEGLAAGRQLLESKGNLTINELMESHTGTNATGHKAQAVKLGIDLNKKYSELTEDEKNKVIEAIKIGEGFKAGTIIS